MSIQSDRSSEVDVLLNINSWFGRSGNNMLQIVRAIYFGITKYPNSEITVHLPMHNLINTKNIIINKRSPVDTRSAVGKNNKVVINDSFFYLKKFDLDDIEPYVYKDIFQKYVKNSLISSIIPVEYEEEYKLFIHIRAGDIFRKSTRELNYVQPPLYYYKHIIDTLHTKSPSLLGNHTTIVYEDDTNPCVNGLKDNYTTGVNFVSSDLCSDIKTLCSSKNLAIGFGTFGFMIYMMNDKLENLYMPRYVLESLPIGSYGKTRIICIELPGYMLPGQWLNTESQREFMLKYST